MGGGRAVVCDGDRDGHLPDVLPEADGAVRAAAGPARAIGAIVSGQDCCSQTGTAGGDDPSRSRTHRTRTLMPNSSFDAIVPMLCVTLAALAAMGAEAFRGTDEK